MVPLKISENAVVNRGIRRAASRNDRMKNDFIYDHFPNTGETSRVEEVKYKRGDRKGSVRFKRLRISIDPASIKSRKDLEKANKQLVQSNNFVACRSAARSMKKAKLGDQNIFGAFSLMANVQRKGTLAKDVFTTCRDVAYREVHRQNSTKPSLTEKQKQYHKDKVMSITCDLAFGNSGGMVFSKNDGEVASCCSMVIDEQNRRRSTGLRRRPKTVDAFVDQCVSLNPKYRSLIQD